MKIENNVGKQILIFGLVLSQRAIKHEARFWFCFEESSLKYVPEFKRNNDAAFVFILDTRLPVGKFNHKFYMP